MVKLTRGRQKVSIAKVEDDIKRQVTFSKRKAGLFKKANEIATLCDAKVAIIVFSHGNKSYSFGNPSVGDVLELLSIGNTSSTANAAVPGHQLANSEMAKTMLLHKKSKVEMLNQQFSKTLSDMKKAKCYRKRAYETKSFTQIQRPRKAIEECNMEELVSLKAKLEVLWKNGTQERERVLMQSQRTLSNQPYVLDIPGVFLPSNPLDVPYYAHQNIKNMPGGFNNGLFHGGMEFSDGLGIPQFPPYNYPYALGFQ